MNAEKMHLFRELTEKMHLLSGANGMSEHVLMGVFSYPVSQRLLLYSW